MERGFSAGGYVTAVWVDKLKLVVEPSDGGGVYDGMSTHLII